MKKTRKSKRKMKNYALGTGSAGTVKNYIQSPDEAIRESEIMNDKIEYDVANNPWTQILDTVGAMAIETGMSMATSGAGGGMGGGMSSAVGGAAEGVGSDVMSNIGSIKKQAKGTGTEGVNDVVVEAERGEVEQEPGKAPVVLGGDTHAEGGNNREVKEGTLYFSNQVKIAGKTAAQRKIAREKKLAKISKLLEKDPSDVVQKETFRRTTEKFKREEEGDLKVQEFAKNLDTIYEDSMAAYGTGEDGVQKMGKGGAAFKDYLGSFSGGDIMSLAGNIYSGVSGINQAKKNAAENTPNENFYKGYADEALKTLDEASGYARGIRAENEKDVLERRNATISQNRNGARGVNMQRAMDLGASSSTNKAIGDIYTNFAKTMMDNFYKKSGVQEKAGQVIAQGETDRDIADRMDKDNADTQLGVAKESMGRAIQQTGKDLNQHSESEYMQNVYNEMYGNDVQNSRDGTLIKKEREFTYDSKRGTFFIDGVLVTEEEWRTERKKK